MCTHHKGISRVINALRWRFKRLVYLSSHEWYRSPPYTVRYHGFHLEYGKGDFLVRAYSITRQYEPHVLAYFQSVLRPGATVVDVGANVGFFALAVLSLIPESTIHMFEPSPLPRSHLMGSISRNGMEARARLNHYALFSEPGEMDFFVHGERCAAYDGFRDTRYAWVGTPRSIKVPVTTLDIYAAQVGLKHLDLLKIDAEGAELFVLKGAEHTLRALRPLVLFEVGDQNLAPYRLNPGDLYQFFEEHGYRVEDLKGQPVSEDEFSQRSAKEHEFVAVPENSDRRGAGQKAGGSAGTEGDARD
jgi:FkbM family methyltransferase